MDLRVSKMQHLHHIALVHLLFCWKLVTFYYFWEIRANVTLQFDVIILYLHVTNKWGKFEHKVDCLLLLIWSHFLFFLHLFCYCLFHEYACKEGFVQTNKNIDNEILFFLWNSGKMRHALASNAVLVFIVWFVCYFTRDSCFYVCCCT